MRHVDRNDDTVVERFVYAVRQSRLLERLVVVDRVVRDLGRIIVPMTGDNAVTIITDRLTFALSCASLSSAPSIMNSLKWSHMSAMINAE